MDLSRRSVLAGLAAVAVAGCSTSNPLDPKPPSELQTLPTQDLPSPTPTSTKWVDETPRWPLTGVPLAAGEESAAAHAPVAVKVPIEKRSFPQTGVDKADLVFVESQGKSYDITRLCAVFHSTWPKEGANPVRSTRPVDVPLMSPLKGVLACTGAVPWVLKYVRKQKRRIQLREKYGDRTDRWKLWSPGGWWKGGNLADKSVVAFPENLSRDSNVSVGVRPPVYFQYAADAADVSTVNGTAAKSVTVTYKGNGTEYHRYKWDAKKGLWRLSIQFQESSEWYDWKVRSGKQIAVPNVMVLWCSWKMGVLPGFKGHVEPIYDIENGKDKFMYLHDGKYVTGTWTKGEKTARFEFRLDDGSFLQMAPGVIWVEMPQHNAKVKLT